MNPQLHKACGGEKPIRLHPGPRGLAAVGPDQQGPHQLLPRPLTQGLDPAPASPSQCALSQTLVVTVCLPTLPGHCAVQLRVRASLCPPPYPSSHAQALWLPGVQGLMQAHDTQIPSFTPSAVQLPRAAGKPGALGSRRATACPAPGGPTPSTLSFCHPVIPTHHPPFSQRTPGQRCPGIYAAHFSPQVIPGQHPHPACPAPSAPVPPTEGMPC